MTKVTLEVIEDHGWSNSHTTIKSALKSLPFYKGRRGIYFHRVRRIQQYWSDGRYSHSAVDFWCGNSGGLGMGRRQGFLAAEIPDDGVLCATCEGRAIGAGQLGARTINGKPVMYSPQKEASE